MPPAGRKSPGPEGGNEGAKMGFHKGQRVKFTETETLKVGRKKVVKTVELTGTISGFSVVGKQKVAQVDVASLLGGNLTITAVKNLEDLRVA